MTGNFRQDVTAGKLAWLALIDEIKSAKDKCKNEEELVEELGHGIATFRSFSRDFKALLNMLKVRKRRQPEPYVSHQAMGMEN